jgi:hypothetical protein
VGRLLRRSGVGHRWTGIGLGDRASHGSAGRGPTRRLARCRAKAHQTRHHRVRAGSRRPPTRVFGSPRGVRDTPRQGWGRAHGAPGVGPVSGDRVFAPGAGDQDRGDPAPVAENTSLGWAIKRNRTAEKAHAARARWRERLPRRAAPPPEIPLPFRRASPSHTKAVSKTMLTRGNGSNASTAPPSNNQEAPRG